MNKFLRVVLLFFLLTLSIVLFVYAANDLTCYFIQSTTCPGGTARIIGLENDSEGYQNAHVQNDSLNTYNYSICCNVTDNASIIITSTCPGNATVLKLNASNNTHVEIGTNSNYSIPVCLGSDWKRVQCSFPTSACASPSDCVLTMAGSEGTNSSNAHVGNCSYYPQRVCCSLENSAPSQPTLYYPANGNTSVFERKPNFNWSTSTDPDGDSVDYTMNITCGSCPATCPNVDVDSLAATNYTLSSPLCVDTSYNWTVSACDPYNSCNVSTIFNFTIASVTNIIMLVNQTSFGTLRGGVSNDTTDDNPTPFVIRNLGNVLLNVTVNASSLFDSVALDTLYYQFLADDNESGSYNTGCSQTTAAYMSASAKVIFCNLSYEVTGDEGEIELNITASTDEPAGDKNSIIQIGVTTTE